MDPLDRFSAALAAEHDGEVATPGVTRSRILERLAKQRTPRSKLRAIWAIPLVMLGAGTALAASGRLPHLLEQGERWFSGGDVPTQPSKQFRRKSGRASALVAPMAETAPVPPSPLAPAEIDLAALESVPSESEASPAPAAARGLAHAKVTSDAPMEPSQAQLVRQEPNQVGPSEPSGEQAPALAASEAPENQAASEPGLVTYAAAQRAHFRTRDHGAAARLYQSYLELSPSGAFVTEARYNLSLCLLRLGRTAEARPILSAFASGAYGSYRQLEASRLLDATAK